MALHIESPEAERMAQALAAQWGTSVEDAVETALRSTLEDPPASLITKKRRTPPTPEEQERRMRAMKEIAARVAALPILDHRSADEILGYGDDGLPH